MTRKLSELTSRLEEVSRPDPGKEVCLTDYFVVTISERGGGETTTFARTGIVREVGKREKSIIIGQEWQRTVFVTY